MSRHPRHGRFQLLVAIVFTVFFASGAAVLRADEAGDLFTKGVNEYTEGKRVADARLLALAVNDLNAFLARYPTHEKSVEAAYILAESYLELRDYPNAGTNYAKVINAGLDNPYAQLALFRVGEIPWINGNYDTAKPLLIDFIQKQPQNVNNRFVLFYLGDIAKHNNAPSEAAYYYEAAITFDSKLTIAPKGEKVAESKLGLAWAKNRLGKYDESDTLYRELTANPSGALAEEAYGSWGTAQYERGAYQEAIGTLSAFLQRYPTGSNRGTAQEMLARSYTELKRYNEALAVLQQISPETDLSKIQETRVLFALKRTEEGKNLLADIDRSAAPQYRDRITVLKMYLAADQGNWTEYIRIGESFLNVRFDEILHRITFDYYGVPSVGNAEKLSQDNFLRACGGLAVAYAKTGNADKAQATYSAMNLVARGGDPVLAEIVRKTNEILVGIVPDQTHGNGNDAIQLRAATQKYMNHDYAGTLAILVPLLGAQYNQVNRTMSIAYTPNAMSYGTSDNGKLSLDSLIEACQMLVLSHAYGGDAAQANAALAAMRALCKTDNAFQQALLTQTRYKLGSLLDPTGSLAGSPGSGTTLPPGGSHFPGSGYPGLGWTPGNPVYPTSPGHPGLGTMPGISPGTQPGAASGGQVSPQVLAAWQREIATSNQMIRRAQYAQVEKRLQALLLQNPGDAIAADAAFLRGQALLALQRERDAISMGLFALEKSPDGPNTAETLWMLGIANVHLDDLPEAAGYFEQLAREYPQSARVDGALYYTAKNELDSRRGDRAKALAKLNKVYRNNTSGEYWSHAAWELAYQSYLKKDYAVADMYLQRLLTHPPDEAVADRAIFLKGQLALESKEWETALVAFATVGRIVDSPLRDYAERNAAVARSSMNNEIRR